MLKYNRRLPSKVRLWSEPVPYSTFFVAIFISFFSLKWHWTDSCHSFYMLSPLLFVSLMYRFIVSNENISVFTYLFVPSESYSCSLIVHFHTLYFISISFQVSLPCNNTNNAIILYDFVSALHHLPTVLSRNSLTVTIAKNSLAVTQFSIFTNILSQKGRSFVN